MKTIIKTIGVLALLVAIVSPITAKVGQSHTSLSAGIRAVSAKVFLEDLPEDARPWATISRAAQFELMHEWVGTVPPGLMMCLYEGWNNVVPRPNEGSEEEVR